jgi:hypothetical protein
MQYIYDRLTRNFGAEINQAVKAEQSSIPALEEV